LSFGGVRPPSFRDNLNVKRAGDLPYFVKGITSVANNVGFGCRNDKSVARLIEIALPHIDRESWTMFSIYENRGQACGMPNAEIRELANAGHGRWISYRHLNPRKPSERKPAVPHPRCRELCACAYQKFSDRLLPDDFEAW
jgi:hypothetical protein